MCLAFAENAIDTDKCQKNVIPIEWLQKAQTSRNFLKKVINVIMAIKQVYNMLVHELKLYFVNKKTPTMVYQDTVGFGLRGMMVLRQKLIEYELQGTPITGTVYQQATAKLPAYLFKLFQ